MNDEFLFSETALAAYSKHIWTQLLFNEMTRRLLTLLVFQKLIKISVSWFTKNVIFVLFFFFFFMVNKILLDLSSLMTMSNFSTLRKKNIMSLNFK